MPSPMPSHALSPDSVANLPEVAADGEDNGKDGGEADGAWGKGRHSSLLAHLHGGSAVAQSARIPFVGSPTSAGEQQLDSPHATSRNGSPRCQQGCAEVAPPPEQVPHSGLQQ